MVLGHGIVAMVACSTRQPCAAIGVGACYNCVGRLRCSPVLHTLGGAGACHISVERLRRSPAMRVSNGVRACLRSDGHLRCWPTLRASDGVGCQLQSHSMGNHTLWYAKPCILNCCEMEARVCPEARSQSSKLHARCARPQALPGT